RAHRARGVGIERDRQQPVLQRIVEEDVAEARRDHGADAEGEQRQHGILAARAAAEIAVGDEDLGRAIGRPVEDEVGALAVVGREAPVVEQHALESGAERQLVEARRAELDGVDIGLVHRHGDARQAAEGLHQTSPSATLRTSARRPASAAAAAMAGLMRWVRPPGPWRPWKLRLEVEAQRSPGRKLSPFSAVQSEQPGSRHSKPAARKILSSPSASAWRLIGPEPGTTQAGTRALPRLAIAAASRR